MSSLSVVRLLLLSTFFALCLCGFTKVKNLPGQTIVQVFGVGSGTFNPQKLSNWQYDWRYPLIPPNPGGSCPGNIYNPTIVQNGGAWNIYFGGWDGVSSCHDSVSISVTLDRFNSFGQHFPQIATGSVIHVNNPSAMKFNESLWLMATTQLQVNPELNKPAMAVSSNGVNWNPKEGGVPSANMQVNGYPNWAGADVNGGNVIIKDPNSDSIHLFFIDFKAESSHSVFHAVSAPGNIFSYNYAGVALEEPNKVVNDLKLLNEYYLMGLHFNGPEVWHTYSRTLDGTFPPSQFLFRHMGEADQFIVSVGFVVDYTTQRLMGALYGAGPVNALDQNKIFAVWLQRKILFVGTNGTVWGVGEADRAFGPDVVYMLTNAPQLEGKFYMYDTDYVDPSNRGTLIAVSDTVVVSQGDIWEYN